MTAHAPTNPDSVVVPAVIKGVGFSHHGGGFATLIIDGQSFSADQVRDTMLAARPAATPGGEREDSAFKIASDLHAAYEQLIYGLPKYLEAENLTDEENMIREAYITLDVTAHRLAALSRHAPVAGAAVDERLKWFLKVIDGAGGEVCSTENRFNPINVFCDDRDNGDDTFNISEAAGFTQTSHDTSFDTSTTRITDKGRAHLATLATPAPQPAAARGGEADSIIRDLLKDLLSPFPLEARAVAALSMGDTSIERAQAFLDALSAKGGS